MKIRNFTKYFEENILLKEKISKLRQKNILLKQEILYRPGGDGYQVAKEDYESLSIAQKSDMS